MSLKRISTILFILLLLSGLGLRLINLDSKLLQEDEYSTYINVTSATFNQLISGELDESLNPPLYRLTVKIFSLLFGTSDFALKFPSVIFGFLSILVIFKIGALFKNRSFAWFPAILFTFSPAMVLYAQFARAYSLLILLGLTSFYFMACYLKEGKTGSFVAYLAFNILGVATHYSFLFLIAADTLCFFVSFRKLKKSFIAVWLSFCALLALALIPKFLILMKVRSGISGFLYEPLSWLTKIFLALYGFALGESVYPFNLPVVIPAFLLFGFAFVTGVYFIIITRSKFSLLFRFFIPLLIWCFFGNTVAVRHVIYITPYFLIIVSLGIFFIFKRVYLKYLVLLLLILLQSISLYFWYTGNASQIMNANLLIPWKEITFDVHEKYHSDDRLILYPSDHKVLFQKYYPDKIFNLSALPEKPEIYEPEIEKILEDEPERIWLIDMPHALAKDSINLGPCYKSIYHKGYLSNPKIAEHYRTGIKIYDYAVTVDLFEKTDSCEINFQ